MTIDAVITWVDGADPAHRKKLDAWLAQSGNKRPASADRTRFNDAGEIDWCIRSILRFAPWFRKIHVVVDGQVPAILDRLRDSQFGERFNVVDHREIFAGFEQHLPTFNSRSIITMLWRIQGLAENFVYFNDDMFLLRAVNPEDFFREGKVVQRGLWRMQSGKTWSSRLLNALKRLRGSRSQKVGNLDSQQLSARIAGFEDRYYRLYHNPYPMRRSTLQAFFAAHPDLLESNCSHRLRSNEQFKTEAVATHLEFLHDNAIVDNSLHVVQLKPSEQLPARVKRKITKADSDSSAAFVCVQSLELAPEAVQREIIEWLDRRIG
ncbi:MAG TPA: stealth family protein [Dokdonella sp.]|uniref:stealth family protein n=1 Tax=Dokdonella sp. TaxID=2291710 RepID=UPI002D7FD0BE|nr:stealth family protein [Dokdonella sp.]HET9032448.1 stealth family protein [Dokdonella sp.]